MQKCNWRNKLNWVNPKYQYGFDIDRDWVRGVYDVKEEDNFESFLEQFVGDLGVKVEEIEAPEDFVVLTGEKENVAKCLVFLTGETYNKALMLVEKYGEAV